MYLFRRAALRLVPSSTSLPVQSRPVNTLNLTRSSLVPRPTAYCLRKRWNSNGPLYQPGSNAAAPAEESGENKSSEAESLEAQTAEGPTAETQSSGPQPAEAKNGQLWTADVENDQVLDAALHAAAAESTRPEYDVSEEDSIAAEHPSLRQFPQDDSPGMRRRPRVTVEPRPKRIVYIGNLFYDVTAQDLKKHMEQFGVVTDIQLVYDKRGLSKGMGYCQFDTIDAAVRAKEAMHRTVYEGRTVSVRFAAHDVIGRRQTNPPSKTIYVGNMPFQMTDRDINDLFKDVPNVIDVRVSMDRRTGQFKGFVHAEFVDIESAKFGFGLLRGRTPHGRELKIDYSLQDRRASPIRQVVSDSP